MDPEKAHVTGRQSQGALLTPVQLRNFCPVTPAGPSVEGEGSPPGRPFPGTRWLRRKRWPGAASPPFHGAGWGPITWWGAPPVHPSIRPPVHPSPPSPGRPAAAPLTHGSTLSLPLLLPAFLSGSLPPALSSRSFPGKCTVSPVLPALPGGLEFLVGNTPTPPTGPRAFSPRLAPLCAESAAFNPSGIALEDGF